MDDDLPTANEQTALYLTPEHPCAYLPGRPSRTLFLDPQARRDPLFYQYLLANGFRRSGDHVYRPHCPNCSACVPVRIPALQFRARRSQRRCWKRNAHDLTVLRKPAEFDAEHYRLYQRYTAARHEEGGMAEADENRYMEFLGTSWCESLFVEFRQGGRLMAVAVTDVMPGALSAVYTFFDPDLSAFSPGVLAILWQIREAQRLRIPHLYLGYWIGESDKMRYKQEYRPLEAWTGDRWRRFDADEPLVNLSS